MNTKQYLGDSVYADFADGSIVLTTENGLPSDPSNTIIINDEVWIHLVQYVVQLDNEGEQNEP